MNLPRLDGRATNELRPITIERHYTKHAEGSVLISFGDTKVLCNASITTGVPKFLKESGSGWLTAEYALLPRATSTRTEREATKGKQSGRTMEIQRLIGRSLRSILDLSLIPDHTITLDCDVIQADGGTRTAAITGSYVALCDAAEFLRKKLCLKKSPIKQAIAAISVGICQGEPLLDLNYIEDSHADTDMNVVMTADGNFVELQGTAEHHNFSMAELNQLLKLAKQGIDSIFEFQNTALKS